MNYINLPDDMYKLPENAINVISTIIKKSDINTVLPDIIFNIIGIGVLLILITIMIIVLEYSYIISHELGLIIINLLCTLLIVAGLFNICYTPYKLEKELTPLKKEYPMMFIAIYPQKYVLTTNYEVKKLNEINDNDIIMNIDINRLGKENIEVFKQIDLLKNGYNKEK